MAIDVDRAHAVADSVQSHSTHVPDPRVPAQLAWLALFLLVLAFNLVAFDQLAAGEAAFLGSENGPLENAQLLMLALALGLFAYSGMKGIGAVRVAGALLAFTGTIIFVRELDFDALTGTSGAFDWLIAHSLQDGLFVLLGLAIVGYLFVRRQYFWGVLRLALRWQAWPCAASVGLLAAAEFYLDGISGPSGHFWEELVEANGYFLLALAAWMHARLIGDPELDKPA